MGSNNDFKIIFEGKKITCNTMKLSKWIAIKNIKNILKI